MRIVSLLPSTTEILFDIGAGDDVVGVTFECDHPAEARERTIVSTSAMPEGLDAAGIDAFVTAAMRAGEDLYHLDEGALSGLDADLVVTQDLCAVCAVDVSVVDDALAHLGCTAEVLTIDPHTLAEVLDSVLTLGTATGHEAEAKELVHSLHGRLDRVAEEVAGPHQHRPPRVLLLEWTDPPFAPGHWVPEMITAAGGVPTIGVCGREVGPGDLGAGARRRSRAGGVRALRLRPRGLRRSRRRAARLRGAARRTCRSGRSTRTRPSLVPVHAWSTAWRTSRTSSRAGCRLRTRLDSCAKEWPGPADRRVSGGAALGGLPHHSTSADGSGGTRERAFHASDDAINQRREPRVRCACPRLGTQRQSGEQYGTNSIGILRTFHSRPTYPSKSCLVSTPTGRPSSCTSRASASRRAAIASSMAAPAPTVGSGSSMCSSTWSASRASPA